jgi:hypothetical protein
LGEFRTERRDTSRENEEPGTREILCLRDYVYANVALLRALEVLAHAVIRNRSGRLLAKVGWTRLAVFLVALDRVTIGSKARDVCDACGIV